MEGHCVPSQGSDNSAKTLNKPADGSTIISGKLVERLRDSLEIVF
jgi:hypothetical protein